MELPAKYDPALTEDKWYAYWLENKFFHSEPDEREPYTVVIPPPNVTGILHMGHVLNNTLNDVLVRKARMDGKRGLCIGDGTETCDKCGFCMAGEMASVFAFKPDTIFAGLKLRA